MNNPLGIIISRIEVMLLEDEEQKLAPEVTTKASGTGLGLSITQRIVQEHGGTIDVAPMPGKGTAFALRLPAASSARDQVETDRG